MSHLGSMVSAGPMSPLEPMSPRGPAGHMGLMNPMSLTSNEPPGPFVRPMSSVAGAAGPLSPISLVSHMGPAPYGCHDHCRTSKPLKPAELYGP